MSVVVHQPVVERPTRLHLRCVTGRPDAVLSEAARTEPTDTVLREETAAKQRTRVTMGPTVAHFTGAVKTLDEFDFKCQPSVDQRLVHEVATGRFVSLGENVLMFGARGCRKTHLTIPLGRAVVEPGHRAVYQCQRVTGRLGESGDRPATRRPPFVLRETHAADHRRAGYLPYERRGAHLFFQRVALRYERGRLMITTNQLVMQWRTPFGDEVLAAAILDQLLHHSHTTLMIHGESFRLLRLRHKKGRAARQQRQALTTRAWTLPKPWPPRTRTPLLGEPHRTRCPTAPTAIIVR